jgi:hypothetical protein
MWWKIRRQVWPYTVCTWPSVTCRLPPLKPHLPDSAVANRASPWDVSALPPIANLFYRVRRVNQWQHWRRKANGCLSLQPPRSYLGRLNPRHRMWLFTVSEIGREQENLDLSIAATFFQQDGRHCGLDQLHYSLYLCGAHVLFPRYHLSGIVSGIELLSLWYIKPFSRLCLRCQ